MDMSGISREDKAALVRLIRERDGLMDQAERLRDEADNSESHAAEKEVEIIMALIDPFGSGGFRFFEARLDLIAKELGIPRESAW